MAGEIAPLSAFLNQMAVNLPASDRVNIAWLPGAAVTDFVVRQDGANVLVAEAKILAAGAGVHLLDLGPVTARLVSPAEGERPFLVRLTVSGQPSLSVHDLCLAVDFSQPWLRRVDPATWQPLGEPLRFEVDAALHVAANGTASCDLFGLSIPPFEIGRTGIIVALDGCSFAVNGSGVPVPLTTLLTGAGVPRFDGVYAARARLLWLPRFRFAGEDHPGFGLNFRDVLFDENGVSFIIDQTWPVTRETGARHRLSADSPMLGRLFDDRLRIAFAQITGTVVQNDPAGLTLDGWIEIAPLGVVLQVALTADTDPLTNSAGVSLTVTQQATDPIDLTLGAASVHVEGLNASGSLSTDAINAEGFAKIQLTLPGLNTGLIDVTARVGTGAATALEFGLRNVSFGPFGVLAHAQFRVTFAEDESISSFAMEATAAWADLAGVPLFTQLPAGLPQPAGSAQATVSVSWDAAGLVTVAVDADIDNASGLFAFLPATFRPTVRDVAFGFRATTDANTFFNAAAGTPLQGEAFARLQVRLPWPAELQDNGVLSLRMGDVDGFVGAELRASAGAGGTSDVSLSINDPASLDFALPGLTDGPIFTAELVSASANVQAAPDSAVTITAAIAGEFGILGAAITGSPLLGPQVAALLDPITSLGLHGTVDATLDMRGDRSRLTMSATLDDAEIDVDLFALIGKVAAGQGVQGRRDSSEPHRSAQQLDMDLSVSVALDELKIAVGQLDDTLGSETPPSVELRFTVGLGGATIPAFVKLSTRELAIGVDGAVVPLKFPAFLLTPDDSAALTDGTGRWQEARFTALIDEVTLDIDLADASGGPVSDIGRLIGKRGLLEYIHQLWASLTDTPARDRFQAGVTAVIVVLDEVTQLTQSDSNVRIEIGGAQIVVPFDDPRQLAVEGTAVIKGFAAGDPWHGLEGLTLRLGLSPDQVYFGLEASGEPIPIPDVGRYQGGTVSLTQFTIGYGFTRNSLAIALAGELVFPEHLTEDADLSKVIGFGIKLPRYNRLAFRLDMIPVPGPIPVVPAFEFALDLRTPGVPPLRDSYRGLPAFDGLEVHVPGLIHADVKALSVSPFFGILPVPNVRFDGDLDLGTRDLGLTIICDDLVWLAGISGSPMPVPIPYLIDPACPYFEHLVVNVRCAGFGINFDIERPLPKADPRMLFEVIALVADPLAPIDLDGPLARSIRIALRDAYVAIPEWAQRFIPGGAELVRREIDAELNVGVVIAGAQWMARTVPPVLQHVHDVFATGPSRVQDFLTNPPSVDPAELLALLPPELRVVRCQVSFAGFEALAAFVLIAPGEAQRHDAATDALWNTPPLNDFDRNDLTALPNLPAGTTGVLIVATVELFGDASFRFVGHASSDGRFALLAAADIGRALNVPLAGLTVPLPLKLAGGLALAGRITANRRHGEVHMSGSADWDVVPNVVHIAAGDDKNPVQLSVSGDGRRYVTGTATVDVLGDLLHVEGTLDASESHAHVTGELSLAFGGTRAQPFVEVQGTGTMRLGPGETWGFEGHGELRLCDLVLADAGLRANRQELAVHGKVNAGTWRIGRLQFDSVFSGSLEGRITFPAAAPGSARLASPVGSRGRTASTSPLPISATLPVVTASPELQLRGSGTIQALGATIDGAVEVDATAAALRVAAEGRLDWLGQTWVAGRLRLSSEGSVEVSGRTSVVLDLTPSDLGFNIDTASLFLRADIQATFGFSRSGGKASHDVHVDWTLGIRLPGGKPNQVFVLAMQKLHIGASQSLNVTLLNVDGMAFIPMGDVVIPIPKITTDGNVQIIRARIDLPFIKDYPVMMTNGLRNLLEDIANDEGFVFDKHNMFKVPKNLKIKTENHNLGELVADVKFAVKLRWDATAGLGFEIVKGSNRQFVALTSL